jgi:hypothetical protein
MLLSVGTQLVHAIWETKVRNSQRLVARLPAVESELAVGTCSHIIRVFSRGILPSCVNQLLGFALPSLLRIMGPLASKCGLSSFLHIWLIRVLLRIISDLGFDRGDNRPATFRSMLQVLEERVVIGFPAVEALMA